MRRLKKELWPYRVNLDVDDTRIEIDSVELWLKDTCGEFRDGWNAVYFSNSTDFYFRSESDATLFALRWT